ncbi:interferon-induced protein with tetratricopeptide repeats 5-like [Clarias gariepinus]|uniref:interferon-induced protein with tetratricopeptide repeats 5-like n=1 Tax=Clarias gariepinus TaxID=13013 RepID=UPI00234D14CC|nr:interferon-induced protein with tetratricopeptide repeats 5-like [Clarias gariepinus]
MTVGNVNVSTLLWIENMKVISSSSSSAQNTNLKTRLLQLECHFTWGLRKNDTDLTYLLKRLEEQLNLDLGGETGVPRTYSYMGFVKFLLGSNTEALHNFERSVELTKAHGNDCDKLLVVAYGDLAWLHYYMGHFTECESYLNKLSEIKEKYPIIPYAEVLGDKGWTFLKFSRRYYDMAKVCFSEALKLDPDDSEWNTGLAIVLHRTEPTFQDTPNSNPIDQLRRAIDYNPDDDVLKVYLAIRLLGQKEYKEAESLVEKALEQSPEHPHVLRYVGKYFRGQGSVDRSIALLTKTLEKVSSTAFIHHQLALCFKKKIINLKKSGRQHLEKEEILHAQEQCINHLETAVELNPCFVIAISELALQYGESGNVHKAEQTFQNAIEAAKKKRDNYHSVLLRYAEFQQYCMRCEPAALKYFTECLKINPNSHEGKRCAENLEKIAKRRIKNNPQDGEAFGILGIVYKEKGEKQQAIEYFEKALSYVDNEDYLCDLSELRLSLQ